MRMRAVFIFATIFAAGVAVSACGQDNSDVSSQATANPVESAINSAGDAVGDAINTTSNAIGHAVNTSTDVAITAAIKSKLIANSTTSGQHIHVDTNSGSVTLSGTVNSDKVEALAMHIASDTSGVVSVTNNLEVDDG